MLHLFYLNTVKCIIIIIIRVLYNCFLFLKVIYSRGSKAECFKKHLLLPVLSTVKVILHNIFV